MGCQCSMHNKGGFHCRVCCETYTSLSAYDKHLHLKDGAYEHRSPEDCGLIRSTRGISLPPSGDTGRHFGGADDGILRAEEAED